ncbi:MAG: putative TetR family transcriptional regulator [Ilumatobacteraceae bacterium]|nr:putative TetR family transcriptional regulator [Ilumatobacteraceae bacterium]
MSVVPTAVATPDEHVHGRPDKRRAILDAAAQMFGELGFERASVDAIALQAGVSKPTIYSHFGTKERLFRESLGESAARLNTDLMAAIDGLDVTTRTWRVALHALGESLVACHQSECSQSLQRQIVAEVKRDPELSTAIRERASGPLLDALATKLAHLTDAGHLRVKDPELAAKQLIALTNAEMVELTAMGTRRAAAADARRAARAGVDAFLAAYAR